MKNKNHSKEKLKSIKKMGLAFFLVGTVLVLLSFLLKLKDFPLLAIGIGQISGGIFMYIYYFIIRNKT